MKMMFDKMTRYMGRRKKYKVGDRVLFEYYDGTVGTAIVLDVESQCGIDANDETFTYDELITWRSGNCSSSIEDYNTLPYSDPRVKELMKELKKQDEFADEIREFVNANTDIYSIETIAAALGQVAKEYGYEEE